MTALQPAVHGHAVGGVLLPPVVWQHRPDDPWQLTAAPARPSRARFQPVTYTVPGDIKPRGGLWTSPLDPDGASTDWTRWCDIEDFPRHPVGWLLRAPANARIYVIGTPDHLAWLADTYPLGGHDALHGRRGYRAFTESLRRSVDGIAPAIDYPALARRVDAIWLTEAGQWSTRHSTPGLYGWDAATVFWLRPTWIDAGPVRLADPPHTAPHNLARSDRARRNMESSWYPRLRAGRYTAEQHEQVTALFAELDPFPNPDEHPDVVSCACATCRHTARHALQDA